MCESIKLEKCPEKKKPRKKAEKKNEETNLRRMAAEEK